MQILNAPTREEVDTAHLEGSWFEIGVPSLRNAFKVSKFKTCCWLGLIVSSVPLNSLFNSAVYSTEYRGTRFHLTIATDEFLSGGPFFPPGASLLTDFRMSSEDTHLWGYGQPAKASDFMNNKAGTIQHLSYAASYGKTWDRIDFSDCAREYLSNCNGLDHHRDLILVVDKPGGWIRNQMWPSLEQGYDVLGYNQSYWDRLVPANSRNHLFYHAMCIMRPGSVGCGMDCHFALGGTKQTIHQDSWTGDRFVDSGSNYSFFDPQKNSYLNLSLLEPGSDYISVQYCLADPLKSNPKSHCYVGLSTTLLFTIALSVVVKSGIVLLVTVVLFRQDRRPLVTLGDSIASFIENPDANTKGLSSSALIGIQKRLVTTRPKKWRGLNKHRTLVIPGSVWIMSYLLFAPAIYICVYYIYDLTLRHRTLRGVFEAGGFLASQTNPFVTRPFTFLGGVLTTNSPQLVLSACYPAYNGLFTRLHVAREWAAYGMDYYPLRVTNPQGMQKSTYRLQLPYKYSVSLVAMSILLHFLISNTLYVIVSFGGYWKGVFSEGPVDSDFPRDPEILVGYSPKSLLALLILVIILVTIPILFSFQKLPPNMVVVGCDSLAISSACHASVLSKAKLHTQPRNIRRDDDGSSRGIHSSSVGETGETPRNESADIELASVLCDHDIGSTGGENTDDVGVLGRIARSKIRWGVVEMPPEWYRDIIQEDDIGHLSFGVEEDEVSPPELNRWYV